MRFMSRRTSRPRAAIGRAVCMTLGLLLAASPGQAADSDGWRLFRSDSALTGVLDAELPDRLDVLWVFEAGDSIESSSTVISTRSSCRPALNSGDSRPRWR